MVAGTSCCVSASGRKIDEKIISKAVVSGAVRRETVEQRIAEGQSAADAEAEFLTNDHFEAWYQDICGQLKQYGGLSRRNTLRKRGDGDAAQTEGYDAARRKKTGRPISDHF